MNPIAIAFAALRAWSVWQAMKRGEPYAEAKEGVVKLRGGVYDLKITATKRGSAPVPVLAKEAA